MPQLNTIAYSIFLSTLLLIPQVSNPGGEEQPGTSVIDLKIACKELEDAIGSQYDYLSKNYLTSLNTKAKEPSVSCITRNSNSFRRHSAVYEAFKKHDIAQVRKIKKINDLPKQEQFFSAFAVADLNLLTGEADKSRSIFNQINKTHTTFGSIQLQKLLTQPTSNKETIIKRQNLLKMLIENEALLNELDTMLADIASNENSLLSFWTQIAERKELTLCSNIIERQNRDGERFSTNDSWFAFKNRAMVDGGNAVNILLNAVGLASGAAILYTSNNKRVREKGRIALSSGAFGAVMYYFLMRPQFKTHREQFCAIMELTKDCANLLYDAQESLQAACEYKEWTEAVPELQKELTALTNKKQANSPLQTIRKALDQSGIRHTNFARYFTARAGKVFAAYNHLRNDKLALCGVLQSIGTIDAFVSMAKLYKDGLHNKNRWSFVEIEEGARPHIRLDGVWNPMLDPERAVASFIELGFPQIAFHALISGPNAGGKSTLMRAIALAIAFAQTFGIAPTKNMVLTLFTSLNTYLNISDDLAQGKSRFKMEAFRAQELVKKIESMPADQFIFTLMDETFSGTDPREGAAAGYSIIKYLSETAPQSMIVAASHYPLLKLLEKNTKGAVKNFKVEAEVNPISYPFNLQEGASNKIIALELLQEEGMDITKELKYVREMLGKPELFTN